MSNKYSANVDFKIINSKEQLELFRNLEFKFQKRILSAGIRKAAKPIITTAKSNFNATKKNKSLTGYADLNSSFKIQENRKNINEISFMVGVKYNDTKGRKNWYKYRFIEYGTDERSYILRKKNKFNSVIGSKQRTGKMTATNFFYDAVNAKQESVQKNISIEVTKQLERIVKKYSL